MYEHNENKPQCRRKPSALSAALTMKWVPTSVAVFEYVHGVHEFPGDGAVERLEYQRLDLTRAHLQVTC